MTKDCVHASIVAILFENLLGSNGAPNTEFKLNTSHSLKTEIAKEFEVLDNYSTPSGIITVVVISYCFSSAYLIANFLHKLCHSAHHDSMKCCGIY